MHWLNGTINFLAEHVTNLWRWLRGSKREAVYRVFRVEEEPMTLLPNRLYVVEDAGVRWAAVMACPGGCGQALHMNLLPDSKPLWRLTEDQSGAATLRPSVWQRKGCGCHFHLRQGKIEWC